MQVCQRAAGFSLGMADILRRAMGKKKESEMQAMCAKFIEGCIKKGHNEEIAKNIWANIEKFAGYGFNKSHSAAYAILAIRTAYLKANFPVEFMAANLTSEMGSADRVSELIGECRTMGIKVLPPDVNSSLMNFSVDKGAIRFGLGAIKGVGTVAAEAIIKAGQQEPFTSLSDFCERVGTHVNRRILEALCQSGAFDGFGLKRSQLFTTLDQAMNQASAAVKDRERGQANFFDILANDADQPAQSNAPEDIPEWPMREILRYEKELLGFYVTGHPLDEHRRVLETFSSTSLSKLANQPDGQGVRLGGLITSVVRKVSKRDGRPWAIVVLEDFSGSAEALVFSETYAAVAPLLEPEQVIFIEGHVSKRDDERVSLQVQKVLPLNTVEEQYTDELLVGVNGKQASTETLEALRRLLAEHRGHTRTLLALGMGEGQHAVVELGRRYQISYNETVRQGLRRLLGERSFKPRPNLTVTNRQSFNRRPPRPPSE